MAYQLNAREKEIENRLRKDYFSSYDAESVLGDVDFAVAVPQDNLQLFEQEFLLWAEAKKSNHSDIYESLVQLIITIGKAKTFNNHLPPAYLGAFDAEKIAFIPYQLVMDVFHKSYINWNVRPSDHSTEEFKLIMSLVKESLEKEMLLFNFDKDDRELRTFIKRNFVVGKSKISKVRINKTNFTAIYQKWLDEVKPTINANWDVAKRQGIIDADFYLADILSENNCYLRDSLHVLLCSDHYELDRQILESGFFDSKRAEFKDKQKAHKQFWNRYDRPPRREYWDDIVTRRDLLVPQDIRETKGSYFTPRQWVNLSQEYLAQEFGDNWQEDYYIWDCAAGTGNLLANLTNKYRIWASTLDKADVDIMHDRIKRMNDAGEKGKQGSNLLDSHVFQFDFLNDSFDKLPQKLKEIIDNPEERRKLIIYINPPYAEAANRRTISGSGRNKTNVAVKTKIYEKYKNNIGIAGRELFAQFLIRIYEELPTAIIAQFSKLKIVQSPNFRDFRTHFRAKPGRNFCVPAQTFDNVKGIFPIGFFIWHTDIKETIERVVTDVYDSNGNILGKKTLMSDSDSQTINDWIITTRNRKYEKAIGYMSAKGNDFQNTNYNFIINSKSQLPHPRGTTITTLNVKETAIYLAARHCIEATWLNDRDQFLHPNSGWVFDTMFQSDCLVYTIFNGQNRISVLEGENHWIPFTEKEVNAKESFGSHFMSDYIKGVIKKENLILPEKDKDVEQTELFEEKEPIPEEIRFEPLSFSTEAQAVLDAGRELWKYYHAQPNAIPDASFYDIRLHFQGKKTTAKGKEQMNTESRDEKYTELISNLRLKMKILASHIEPKIYDYGFLKRNYDRMIKGEQTISFEGMPIDTTIHRSRPAPINGMPPADEEAQVAVPSLAQVLNPNGGMTNVNITVNINKFEKPVGAVIQTGGNQNINEILEIKKEE